MTGIEDFAEFVRTKRQALGLTISDLSYKVFGNRRDNYICDLENGRRKGITLDIMVRILTALNTELTFNER